MFHHNPDHRVLVNGLFRCLLPALVAVMVSACFGSSGSVVVDLRFDTPQTNQLSMTGDTGFVLLSSAPGELDEGSLALYLNEQPIVPTTVTVSSGQISGEINIDEPGVQELRAEIMTASGLELSAEVAFETAALEALADCEVLNQAECLLPYPSTQFLSPASTPTGWRVDFPASGMLEQFQVDDAPRRLSPEPYSELDGFSPTVQPLMHFPGPGVDVEASAAPRILAATRTTDGRSLEADSPTVLIDAVTGERVHHWVETDARAVDPERQVLFLRPGKALEPGRRYLVAVRDLVDVTGEPIMAEPVFTVFRDERPTDIEAVESRREEMAGLFSELNAAGVEREGLLLAFDFVVQSEAGLTAQMKTMRDESLAEIAAEGAPGFTVDNVVENDCSAPDTFVWREITGTYEVPLYLDNDPEIDTAELSFLVVDEQGEPQKQGTTQPPFTVAIPCTILDDDGEILRPLLLGHGLFGTGSSMVLDLIGNPDLESLVFIGGATDFRGLSSPDLNVGGASPAILKIFEDFDNFTALPDRLRQGILNNLVLAHMMKQGYFNSDPAFQLPDGSGVFPGPAEEMYYFGASLGGIMGTMFASLTPDVDKLNVDVPAINFASLMLQRSTQFIPFGQVFDQVNPDPMAQALGLALVHELWAQGEPAGYMAGLRERLAGADPEIDLLVTVAWLDQQVTPLAAETIPRTLELPQLIGSFQSGMVQIPDQAGPLSSAYVVYDTGSYDLDNPDHEPFIPPLTNEQAQEENSCNPHGTRGFIPASVAQASNFLQPGGLIENFCEGICDASVPSEIPFGEAEPCDPLNP